MDTSRLAVNNLPGRYRYAARRRYRFTDGQGQRFGGGVMFSRGKPSPEKDLKRVRKQLAKKLEDVQLMIVARHNENADSFNSMAEEIKALRSQLPDPDGDYTSLVLEVWNQTERHWAATSVDVRALFEAYARWCMSYDYFDTGMT